MEKTLQVLNEMERLGLIVRYAIGGAVGAIFYMEPILTYDLDVFVRLPSGGSHLTILAPLYDYLRAHGYRAERECITIEGVPVQFLPDYNALVEEALSEAKDTTYEDTPTRVFRAEHLAAIMLQTGRPKDRERLASFVDEGELDRDYLKDILDRYDLATRWKEWVGEK